MRLFLSSYRAGKHEAELKSFIGNINKIAVITNAIDYKTPEDRDFRLNENFEYYRSQGLEPTEVDLRSSFHKEEAEGQLKGFQFIWLAGGNVFLLRRALKYAGLDKYLTSKVKNDEIILGGESAGAIVMGPTLKYSQMDTNEDSPNYIPDGYHDGVIWDGLSLVNFVPIPHYLAEDYGDEINRYIQRLDKVGIPHREMTNDQAIVINGDKEEFLG